MTASVIAFSRKLHNIAMCIEMEMECCNFIHMKQKNILQLIVFNLKKLFKCTLTLTQHIRLSE